MSPRLRTLLWGVGLIVFGLICIVYVSPSFEGQGAAVTGYFYIGIFLILLGILVLAWKSIRRRMLIRSTR